MEHIEGPADGLPIGHDKFKLVQTPEVFPVLYPRHYAMNGQSGDSERPPSVRSLYDLPHRGLVVHGIHQYP
jgi:hypothetical protein